MKGGEGRKIEEEVVTLLCPNMYALLCCFLLPCFFLLPFWRSSCILLAAAVSRNTWDKPPQMDMELGGMSPLCAISLSSCWPRWLHSLWVLFDLSQELWVEKNISRLNFKPYCRVVWFSLKKRKIDRMVFLTTCTWKCWKWVFMRQSWHSSYHMIITSFAIWNNSMDTLIFLFLSIVMVGFFLVIYIITTIIIKNQNTYLTAHHKSYRNFNTPLWSYQVLVIQGNGVQT